jgi:PPP family 3-phenylpropionic acid transporter
VASTLTTAIHKELWISKLAYFSYFGAMAGVMPFLTLYYDQMGLTAAEIGLLVGITPVLNFIAAPLWGALADATQKHKPLLLLAIGGAITMMAIFLLANNLAQFVPIILLYALFSAPISPLIDNTVLYLLGEQRAHYGRIRLWGALGWGVAGAVIGFLVDRFGLRVSFISFFLFMSSLFVMASYLPVAPSHIGSRFWQGARSLFADTQWNVLLVTLFCGGLATSISNNFLFLYVDQLGGSRTLMGLSLTVSTLSEIPIFFFSGQLLQRWGARGLLLAALIAQVIRIFAYALMPSAWFILPISLLHGLTFSAMWAAGVAYASKLAAPKGLVATAQGLLSGVSMGLGGVIGALIGGLLYDRIGPAPLFGLFGVIALLGLGFFLIAGRETVQTKPVATEL